MAQTIHQTIQMVSDAAKPRQEKRVINSIKPGQMIRQGDIYAINVTGLKSINVFKTIDVNLSSYTSIVKTNKTLFQLVPGSTMGSRHQVRTNEVVLSINPTNGTSLVGPMIHAEKSFDILHPEHAHFNLPAGDYLICYQLNAKTKQRVKD
jgi:hypothetical protein